VLLEHLGLLPDVCTREPSSDADTRRRHHRVGGLQWTSHGPRRPGAMARPG